MEQYNYVTSYKDNEKVRAALNKLTTDTFGFDFEAWYQNGYWKEESYMPHSLMDGERMVANVSANRMEFVIDGETKHYIQIGTVMMAKEYQGQGLGRYLMEKVIALYQEESDGIYLFGNDSVLNYYPKFGFQTSKEYVYKKTLQENQLSLDKDSIEFIEIKNPSNEERQRFFDYIHHAVTNDGMTMRNVGLMGFYLHDMEGVYYNKKLDVYVVAEIADETLYLNAIIAKEKVELDRILDSFAGAVKTVVLGFVPDRKDEFEVEEFREEDCTLFYIGEELERVEEEKLHFPTLSHA
ncbi:GNAT family N-acetyltransferase [Anaerosporobacter sp.]|uniref:GNAT family N-acetyltransferase n=1 Tax=Anaerosporobacter sp. TaxID=1872529 RepID=UPI00286ED962|nr:GNAT family N-acetyltransferase [Anaerosporobacter sp.]